MDLALFWTWDVSLNKTEKVLATWSLNSNRFRMLHSNYSPKDDLNKINGERLVLDIEKGEESSIPSR